MPSSVTSAPATPSSICAVRQGRVAFGRCVIGGVSGAFEDDDVTHIEGDIDPVRDLEIIAEELRLKDEDMLAKNLEKLERTVVRGGDKKLKPEYVSTRGVAKFIATARPVTQKSKI
jgi:ribosome-binding ATPase YchF (GTP1/OBG family)